MAEGKGPKPQHKTYAETGNANTMYSRGRPAQYAKGGVVEGVRQRAGIAMGGDYSGKDTVSQNPGGKFQKHK